MGVGTAIGVTGLATAGIGAAASSSAAGEQASAANNATETQAQEAQNALDFQKQEWNTQQTNEAPFLQAGQGAIGTLAGMVPQLNQNEANYPQFQAPTEAQAQQTPGYQFALQQGEGALQNSAAAQGGLLTGNTAEAINNYAQNAANTNYQNVYSNALNTYSTQYNQFQQQQNNAYNRYANIAGLGQVTAGQLGSQGQAAASNAGNIDVNLGQQIGQNLNNAAAARASGYVGASNSITGGINGIGQLSLLNSMGLLNGGGGSQINAVPYNSSSVDSMDTPY